MHRRVLAIVATALPLAAQSERAPEPFMRLHLERWEPFQANPQARGVWQVVRTLVADHSDSARQLLADAEQFLGRLPMPLTATVHLDAKGRPTIAVFGKVGAPSLTEHLLASGGNATKVEVRDAEFTAIALDRSMTLLEGELDGQRIWLATAPASADAAAVELALAGRERIGPATRRLQEAATGFAHMLINVDALLAALPPAARGSMTIVRTLLGPRFAGVCVSLAPDEQHLRMQAFVDLPRGQGMLGALLPEPGPRQLLGWVPADSREFTNVRVSMRGLAGLLKFAGTFGLPLDPGDWGEGFEGLAGIDVADLLESELSGEFQFLAEPTLAAEALDPEAEVPGVFLFGAQDGDQLERTLASLLHKWSEHAEIVAAPELGPRAHTVRIGDEDLFHYVGHRDFLAVTDTSKRSVAHLRAMLATAGQAQLPTAYVDRVGAPDAAAVVCGLGHLLSEIQGRVMMRDITGKGTKGPLLAEIVQAIAAEFAGDLGLQASLVTADERGVHVRSAW